MAASDDLHVVTGAFGYSGRYITARLLKAGRRVRTLTNSPQRQHPFGTAVDVHPYNFDRPDALVRSLEGARVLVNTYWVRFDHDDFTHAAAVRHTLALFAAARLAGVARVVHVSITNPSLHSDLPYFRGKAELEVALRSSGLSYAILRPTVLFGDDDILINNIAWMLRRFPIFGVFGSGDYQLQPIFVDDLAGLAVEAAGRSDDAVIDAIGPETFTYRELVAVVGGAIGCRRPVVSLPPVAGFWFGRLLGVIVGDVVVTREEIAGLMRNLLVTGSPPAGHTKLSEWAREHRESLGRYYSSELARRRDRRSSYAAQRRPPVPRPGPGESEGA